MKNVIIQEYLQQMKNAIICDLDGTLAINDHGRDFFDATDCDKDAINVPVCAVVQWAWDNNNQIIFLSGREDKYRKPTIKFLDKCGFDEGMYTLLMRGTGDNRKDSIIKLEIYEEIVKPALKRSEVDILFMLDDRDQVVKMWREQGLTVFQVAEGDF